MNEIKKYWWQFLLAIPPKKESVGFKRIERIIRDKTRINSDKLNEFYNSNHETNLTCSLWENFSIFDNYEWINKLTELTDNPITDKVISCNWSYEWETPNNRLCDVVINFHTVNQNGIIVIEAKNLGKSISDKDTNPDYYLGINDFEKFDCKYLIYCVDEIKKIEIKTLIFENKHNWGIISWQDLANLQIKMVDKLKINNNLQTFIKSSIYGQCISKKIIPTTLIEDYLNFEPDMDKYLESNLKVVEMQEKIWIIKSD